MQNISIKDFTTEFLAAALLDLYYHNLTEMNFSDVLVAEKKL